MAGSANSIQTHNVLRGRLSEDNVIAGTVGTGYNPTYALVGEAAAQIVLYINSSDYKMYAELKDKNGNHIMNSNIIDLPLETMVVNGSYDSETKEVVLILDNGNEIRFSVADLVRGLVSEEGLATILGDYVKFTDYATDSVSGVLKTNFSNSFSVNPSNGVPYCDEKTYEQYGSAGNGMFIGKQTLENVITGKQLVNKTYVDEADDVFEEDLFGDASIIDSGESIILNNTIEKAPLSITLKGNTYQETTTGKNLLNNTLLNSVTTKNGITATPNSDGSVTLNGTATNSAFFNLTQKDFGSVSFNSVDGGSTQYIATIGTTNNTVRLAYDNTNHFAYIVIWSGTVNNLTIYPMIRLASITDDTYEPYTNGASPNPDYPQEVEVVTGLNEVVVEGKNLCNGINQNLWLNANASSYGITSNNSGLCIELDGVSDYTISSNVVQERYRIGMTMVNPLEVTSGFTKRGYAMDNTSGSRTISSTEYKYLIVNATDLTKIQIEKGSQATTYEAYKGQTYEVNLGKNLFDVSKVINGTWNNPESTTRIILYLDKVKKGTTISVTNNGTSGYRFATGFTRLGYPDTSNVMVNESGYITSSTYTITADNDGYPFLQITKLNNTNISPSEVTGLFQIEKSDTPTSYAPYFTPIELCKIGTYQDRIYKNNGNWYLHKEIGKVVLDGSEDWGARARAYCYSITTVGFIRTIDDRVNPTMISNYTKRISTNQSDAFNIDGITQVNGNRLAWNNCIEQNSNFVDLDTFKNWLSTHNTIVYYPLATPTETQITDTTLISQLNALYNATSYNTQTNINQVNANLPFVLDISTFKNTTKGKIEALEQEDENYEKLSNKVIELSSSSTDTEYPSAKCVYNLIGNIESTLETLDIGTGV